MEKMHLFAAKVELFFWNHVASLCVQNDNFIFNFIFRTGNVQIKDFFHSSFPVLQNFLLAINLPIFLVSSIMFWNRN